MKWWLIAIAIFFLLGSFLIIRAHQIDLKEDEGRSEFLFKFSRWVFSLFDNVFKTVGFTIGLDWLPEDDVNGSSS